MKFHNTITCLLRFPPRIEAFAKSPVPRIFARVMTSRPPSALFTQKPDLSDFNNNNNNNNTKEHDMIDLTRAWIPEEIKHKVYGSERELCLDMEQLNVYHHHIVLNHDGFPVWREMPGNDHRSVIDEITIRFDEWKNGRSVKCTDFLYVYVNDSFNWPKNEKRRPSFAIFGPDRLDGRKIRIVNGNYMNPHVIVQFSCTCNNDIKEDVCAVDDMMHYAGVGEYIHLGRPNVAYLIKALRRGTLPDSPVYGFDVFQVGQDQTTPEEPTMKYRCGVQEDTVISIDPASMGLEDDEGEPFNIEMSRQIREGLEYCEVEFVPALGDEV